MVNDEVTGSSSDEYEQIQINISGKLLTYAFKIQMSKLRETG